MLADKRVIDSAKRFITVIIRRPHAYAFSADHGKAPIPGFVFLDKAEAVKGTFTVPAKKAAEKFLEAMDSALR